MAKKEKEIGKKLTCICCNKTLADSSFYQHRNKFIREKASICKSCVDSILGGDITPENEKDFRRLLRTMDLPYVKRYVDAAINANVEGKIGKYISMVNSFVKNKHHEDGDSEDSEIVENVVEEEKDKITIEQKEEMRNLSAKNEADCIRLLGYDPFDGYIDDSREFLFNGLVDYLDDESIRNDGFRLSTVLEICQLFLQTYKLNQALNFMNSDIDSMIARATDIKTLSDTKSKIISNINSIAKDNGISVNYNKNKTTKGAGTVSGITKELLEKGIDEANINMFDIETSRGMLQVAKMSDEAIREQLMWDENEYTEMIADQRTLIKELQTRANKAEEELRLAKIKIDSMSEEM